MMQNIPHSPFHLKLQIAGSMIQTDLSGTRDNITCFINVFPMLRNGAECTGDTLSAKIW